MSASRYLTATCTNGEANAGEDQVAKHDELRLGWTTPRSTLMKQTLLHEKYPVYSLALDRDETAFESVDAICGYFRACIEAHPSATFIAEFDHLAHTRSLPEGRIGEGIRAAKNLVFCFGITLPNVQALAMRPRSIGVAETDAGFLVTFMEAPMPVANAAMEDWATRLRQTQPASP
jgi:hypothetical protein